MPTVLYSADFGTGLHIPRTIKARYLGSDTATIPAAFIGPAFERALAEVSARTIGGSAVGTSERARAIPAIAALYFETRTDPAWGSMKALTFSDIFADWWYVSEHDGRETLHINVDGPFYQISEAYFAGLIDDRTFCNRFREAQAARADLLNAIEMGEIAAANIDIHSNRMGTAQQQSDRLHRRAEQHIAQQLERELCRELLEVEDAEESPS